MSNGDQLSTGATPSPIVSAGANPTPISPTKLVVFTIVGTGIFGFILWAFSEFLSLRGVLSLTLSRIILGSIWVTGTLGALIVVARVTTTRRVKLFAIVLSSIVLACSLLALDAWAPTVAKPETALRFVYTNDPCLMVGSISDAGAHDISWNVEIWNMDLPDRRTPLPIPNGTVNWLKPRSENGPLNLFDAPDVKSLLQPGNHLVGSAMVDCAACSVGKTYVIDIVWGEGGWFSELGTARTGQLVVPKDWGLEGRQAYFKQVEAIPLDRRIQIPPGITPAPSH
jgi:hypothetical protein